MSWFAEGAVEDFLGGGEADVVGRGRVEEGLEGEDCFRAGGLELGLLDRAGEGAVGEEGKLGLSGGGGEEGLEVADGAVESFGDLEEGLACGDRDDSGAVPGEDDGGGWLGRGGVGGLSPVEVEGDGSHLRRGVRLSRDWRITTRGGEGRRRARRGFIAERVAREEEGGKWNLRFVRRVKGY